MCPNHSINKSKLTCSKAKMSKSIRGRSTSSVLPVKKINPAVPSIESDRTVGRHTPLRQRDRELLQKDSGAPAPGDSVVLDMMRGKRDEMRRKRVKMDAKRFKARRSRVSEEDDKPWSEKKKSILVRGVINSLIIYFGDNLPPMYSLFSKNLEISSKISGFMKSFNIPRNTFLYQCGFAAIESITGLPILIGPFKPVYDCEKKHIDHSEEQCIREIKKKINGKEQTIRNIYIFTKYSPCVDRIGCESCTSQLDRFSEEMYRTYNINVIITFQDFYGASGNIVKELKHLINDDDPIIKDALLCIKGTVNKHHCRSTFECFQGEKKHTDTSKTIKNHIITETKKLGENVILFPTQNNFEMYFPSKKMTLQEWKSFGEKQADKLKTHVKKLNVSEEISGKVCSLFHSKWCELVNEEYEEFIYKMLSDYINSLALRFACENIKANNKHFNLIRGNVTD